MGEWGARFRVEVAGLEGGQGLLYTEAEVLQSGKLSPGTLWGCLTLEAPMGVNAPGGPRIELSPTRLSG